MNYSTALLLGVLGLTSCAPFSSRLTHSLPYDADAVPTPPTFGQEQAWAALPDRLDEADGFPKKSQQADQQASAAADVFFIYPTIYTDAPKGRFPWNASTTDAKLNKRIDESSIRLQASVFNAAGRVFAPRYRQAHISAYYTQDSAIAKAAFDLAYDDVRTAFKVFLRKYNQGRPIIIAGHSQGTTMAKRLVRDFFDPGGPMQAGAGVSQQLVAAYLVGIEVAPDYFATLPVCASAEQTGCFVSWRTWQRPASPANPKGKTSATAPFGKTPNARPALVVNPLSWTTDTLRVDAEQNPGGTLRKLKLRPGLSDAQVHEGILWIERPHFFGKRIIRMYNWHPADYNLFYESVRRNAVERVEAFKRARSLSAK